MGSTIRSQWGYPRRMVAKAVQGAPRFAARGPILTPLASGGVRFWRDGLLVSDSAGRIQFVGATKEIRKKYFGPVRDYRTNLMVPGFVDAHLHFPQTRIIGAATGPLLDWLAESVFPEEARFRRGRYPQTVAVEFVDRMLAAGTTTACIFSSSSAYATEVLFAHLAERGMRAVAGLTLMDQHAPDALLVQRGPALAACRRLIKKWHGYDDDRLRFAVTPRFALSCSRDLLRAAGRLAARHQLLVQTHIAETRDEAVATLRAHPYARDYLEVYALAGLVGERTLLAHAIHLSGTQWRSLKRAGASVVHCPDSNFFLGSGRMPFKRAIAHSRALALGSDIAAGRSFSMRRAMAYAYDNARCLGVDVRPEQLLRLATLEGARALHCAGQTGSLEVGKDADVVVMPTSARVNTQAQALAALVFDTDLTTVKASFVRGAAVHMTATL